MGMRRSQQEISSLAVLIFASAICWLSFTDTPEEAFLFPRLIAIVFVLLACWNFVQDVLFKRIEGDGFCREEFMNLIVGLGAIGLYVFFLAKFLGFYTASSITFFCLCSFYDTHSHQELKVWLKRCSITFVFMMVMYGLFHALLQVQTPRGILF